MQNKFMKIILSKFEWIQKVVVIGYSIYHRFLYSLYIKNIMIKDVNYQFVLKSEDYLKIKLIFL
jgi:hypothetical protein